MRSIWKGAISFGLINIPVRLYKASHERELKFKLLHKKDLSEIRYARICKADGKEVPWEDIVKGYPSEGGRYIVLTDEDFERANPKKTKTIEIESFTEEREIDTIYYETPYYLEPEKGSAKAYILLREALKKSKKVAVGSFVFKNHEHLGLIKPHGDLLVLNQLRYDVELASAKEIEVPKQPTLSKNEIDIALKFIDQLTKPFHPKDYADTYTEEVKEIIKKKEKGRKGAKKSRPEKARKTAEVHDIVALLQESLKEEKKKPKKWRAA